MLSTKYNTNNSERIKSAVLADTKINFQSSSSSDVENQQNQFVNQNNKLLKACISSKQGIHPRTFCRRWFGLEAINEYGRPHFTKEQILAMESEHGYREQCINLLAKILKIKPNTIHRWGKGVAFDKIPDDKREKYEVYLGYVDTIRIMATSLQELNEDSLLKVLQRLEIRQ